ncbi:MAG TPA: acetate--CoA ligase family protein [Synergistaceae bacterium]|nr:acetate--CoA ligase family protein [Synergistaceae bacterium]HPQ37482.1 acetate--CoA ligase family protein [Synergistaceae bacterium]
MTSLKGIPEPPDLDRLFAPRSVAFIGASPSREKIAGRSLPLLLEHGYEGRVYPVNPKYDSLENVPCFSSVEDLPEIPDVAFLSLRAPLIPSALESCVRKKIPFGVVLSAGFGECGNMALQEEILHVAQKGNLRILGPNCQGFAYFHSKTYLSFSTSLKGRSVEPGGIAYVSQSGAFGFSTFASAVERGVRFHSVITTGNQADLDVVDVARYLLRDARISAILLYLEGLRPGEGERFVEMVQEAHERGIPLGVLKAGNESGAGEVVQSHTGTFTGESQVWKSLFRQYGVIPLEDAQDIADMGLLLETRRNLGGKRVGICTTSGGAGIVTTDCCVSRGLEVPRLSEKLRRRIEPYIPIYGSSKNPVDVTAQIMEEPEGYISCLQALAESGEVDMLLAVHTMLSQSSAAKLTDQLIWLWNNSSFPLGCCWLTDDLHGSEARKKIREAGIPLFRSPRSMARAFGALAKWRVLEREDAYVKLEGQRPRLPDLAEEPTEYEAKKILRHYSVPVTREYLCSNLRDAMDAAEDLGWFVALKIISPQIPHKSEAGGVVLNIRGEEQLRNAYGRILEKARLYSPRAEIRGVLVQEMVPQGLECMVGMRRDPIFGPIVLLGLGGIYTEILSDVSIRRAPISPETALHMMYHLQGYPLLRGDRGQPPRDTEALQKLLLQIANLALVEDSLEELDCNPVFLFPRGEGLVVADAFMRRRK